MIIEIVEIGSVIEIIEGRTATVEVFTGVGEQGPMGIRGINGAYGIIYPETVLLGPEHIAQKYLILEKEPETDFLYFHPSGGPPQTIGECFQLFRSEKKVSWANFELEEYLEVGDKVDIFYSVSLSQ